MSNVVKCQFSANFGMLWLLFVSFSNFLQFFLATFTNFCHVLANFDKFWQICFFATVGKFKPLFADFSIFLATFGCSFKLLATLMNFLSLKSTFATFWQFLPLLDIFLAILATFGDFWQLLPLTLPYHQYHVIKPSCHLVISSYFHLIILSSCHQPDSLKICQLVYFISLLNC